MALADVVGHLIRQGMSGATQSRLEHAIGSGGQNSNLAGMLGNLLGGGQSGPAAGQGPAADRNTRPAGQAHAAPSGDQPEAAPSGNQPEYARTLREGLSQQSGVGGLSRGQVAGIGALAGALLGHRGGGTITGAIGGSAMALLGTLALSAVKDWQAEQAGQAPSTGTPAVSPQEIEQVTSPQAAELSLRGMIEAAKADGTVSADERQRILGKLDQKDGVSDQERQFIEKELASPPNLPGLVAAIPNKEVGAQVYAAALMAITVDTESERRFLAQLARGIGLDAGVVQRLHGMVGAPAASA